MAFSVITKDKTTAQVNKLTLKNKQFKFGSGSVCIWFLDSAVGEAGLLEQVHIRDYLTFLKFHTAVLTSRLVYSTKG